MAIRLTLPRQVFLVRHAEREWEGEDPPLVAAGEARAQALAETLRDAGITRIITTQWRRTRDTAQPLAKLLRITPQVIPVFEGKARENVEEVAAAVRRYKDETVLIVGHITVTGVIAALGGPQSADDLRQRIFRSVLVHAGCRRSGVAASCTTALPRIFRRAAAYAAPVD